jgi:hypothetical protein
MDVHCCNCGEPWDQYHLRHDVPKPADEAAAEGWEFGRSRLVVLRCPCCPKDGSGLPDAIERGVLRNELARLLGDDEDGLAATMEDFGL